MRGVICTAPAGGRALPPEQLAARWAAAAATGRPINAGSGTAQRGAAAAPGFRSVEVHRRSRAALDAALEQWTPPAP
jgi:hypothetical protein